VLRVDGLWYWYGEDRSGPTKPSRGCDWRTDFIGVRCYSSPDLRNWTDEGLVLCADLSNPDDDLHPSRVVERPKVVRNPATGQFVMWLHIDTEDYSYARAGVAVADHACGPFRYLGSCWPNGADSRDLTLFHDDDETCYLIHSSEWNRTIYIARLSADYLRPSGDFVKAFVDQSREAPAVFKRAGTYYMVTSGCTGWAPNATLYAVAPTMLGRWELRDRFCEGPGAATGFGAQPSFVVALPGGSRHIYLADRWQPTDLGTSGIVWLPVDFDDDRPRVTWHDTWTLTDAANG
jgi:beta-galactosidase